jgi:hypothetical protein
MMKPVPNNNFEENQVVVVARRDNELVFIVATAWSIVKNLEDLEKIAESLTFN